jgi:hypothetical protein
MQVLQPPATRRRFIGVSRNVSLRIAAADSSHLELNGLQRCRSVRRVARPVDVNVEPARRTVVGSNNQTHDVSVLRSQPEPDAAADLAPNVLDPHPDARRAQEPRLDELARAVDAKRQELEALNDQLERVKRELHALGDSDGPAGVAAAIADEPDRSDFVVIGIVNGRYVVHLGRGTPPAVGAKLRLPDSPNVTSVVARNRWRRCLYLE